MTVCCACGSTTEDKESLSIPWFTTIDVFRWCMPCQEAGWRFSQSMARLLRKNMEEVCRKLSVEKS